MKVRWKLLLIKGVIWLISEILLTFVGLDDLADYSEVVFDKNTLNFPTAFVAF